MKTSLCPYKYLFGKPNTGVHTYRIFNIAIVDVICTLIVAYIISTYFKLDFKEVSIALFLLGIIAHRLYCVRTTVDKLLFPE